MIIQKLTTEIIREVIQSYKHVAKLKSRGDSIFLLLAMSDKRLVFCILPTNQIIGSLINLFLNVKLNQQFLINLVLGSSAISSIRILDVIELLVKM